MVRGSCRLWVLPLAATCTVFSLLAIWWPRIPVSAAVEHMMKDDGAGRDAQPQHPKHALQVQWQASASDRGGIVVSPANGRVLFATVHGRSNPPNDVYQPNIYRFLQPGLLVPRAVIRVAPQAASEPTHLQVVKSADGHGRVRLHAQVPPIIERARAGDGAGTDTGREGAISHISFIISRSTLSGVGLSPAHEDNTIAGTLPINEPIFLQSVSRGHCLDMGDTGRILTYPCHYQSKNQAFFYTSGLQLQAWHNRSLCLTAKAENGDTNNPITFMQTCLHPGHILLSQQQWNFDAGVAQRRAGSENVLKGVLRNKYEGDCLALSTDYRSAHLQLAPCTFDLCSVLWRISADMKDILAKPPAEIPEQVRERQLQLAKQPTGRIFCWVTTHTESHHTKADMVQRTWGRDCNSLTFIPDDETADLSRLTLEGGEQRDNLWEKTRRIWQILYRDHLFEADWFFRSDDNAYVIMPHLHSLLAQLNPKEPHYLGRRFWLEGDPDKIFVGGPGQVLSRGALKLLGDAARTNPSGFGNLNGFGVVELAMAFKRLQVFPTDTRDEFGSQRFIAIGLGAEHSKRRRARHVQEVRLG